MPGTMDTHSPRPPAAVASHRLRLLNEQSATPAVSLCRHYASRLFCAKRAAVAGRSAAEWASEAETRGRHATKSAVATPRNERRYILNSHALVASRVQ